MLPYSIVHGIDFTLYCETRFTELEVFLISSILFTEHKMAAFLPFECSPRKYRRTIA